MSTDETRHVSSTGGQKAGNDERYDLIPVEPLRLLAKHYGVGAKKYADDNWRKGYDWRLSYAALCRHLNKFWAGEDIDEETGTPHIIAVAWHAFTLQEFSEIHPEFDTRLKTPYERSVKTYPADDEDQAFHAWNAPFSEGESIASFSQPEPSKTPAHRLDAYLSSVQAWLANSEGEPPTTKFHPGGVV